MKYFGVSLVALILALGVETGAQDNPFSSGRQGLGVMPGQNLTPCPDYKIVIITPPKDVDFKMQVSTPAKNMDRGIIFKPCTESNQLAFGPKIIMPNQEMSDYLKGILTLSRKKK